LSENEDSGPRYVFHPEFLGPYAPFAVSAGSRGKFTV
jgi:hypothetical protein